MKAIAIMGSGCVHDRRVLLSAAAAEAELLFQLAVPASSAGSVSVEAVMPGRAPNSLILVLHVRFKGQD